MTNRADFVMMVWCGLENGAPIFGYSDWRSFKRAIDDGRIPGARKDAGVHFSEGMVETLPAHLKTFQVPIVLNPVAICLLSSVVSSAIKVTADLGKAKPTITLEPCLSGAKVEIIDPCAPGSKGKVGILVFFDKSSGRTFYRYETFY